MQLTLFIGQILSIIWVVMGLAIIVHNQRFKKVFNDFCEKPSLLALSGFLSLTLGAILVSAHNIWVFNIQGLITVLGWVIFLHGFMRLVFPEWVSQKGKQFLMAKNGLMFMAWVVFLLGLYLGYMTFYHIPSMLTTM